MKHYGKKEDKIDKTIIGLRFGRLVVAEYAGKDRQGHSRWRCLCDCGKVHVVERSNLVAGLIVSCGCHRREMAGKLNLTHGGSNSRLYSIYQNMISRTENPRATAYDCYGGRGITICPEWRSSFSVFRTWALANGYRDDLSIDRIKNDKNYSPNNCRWVKMNAQFNNRRSNRLIDFNGETKTIAEWARCLSLNRHTLHTRLNAGWSIARALTTPRAGCGAGATNNG